MTWIKLDDGFPSNPKIVGLSNAGFRLYIEALCYSGRYLTDGQIPAPALARLQCVEASDELIEAGLWARAEDGIEILSYMEYQTSKTEVLIKREQTRARSSRYRSSRSVTRESRVSHAVDRLSASRVSHATRIQNTDNRIQRTDIKDLFDHFWSVYPRKTAKGAALKSFEKALKRADAQTIIAAAKAYAEDPNRDPKFTAHGSTWLNQDRWCDGALPPRHIPPEEKRAIEAIEARKRDEARRAMDRQLDESLEAARASAVPMPEFVRDILRGVSPGNLE